MGATCFFLFFFRKKILVIFFFFSTFMCLIKLYLKKIIKWNTCKLKEQQSATPLLPPLCCEAWQLLIKSWKKEKTWMYGPLFYTLYTWKLFFFGGGGIENYLLFMVRRPPINFGKIVRNFLIYFRQPPPSRLPFLSFFFFHWFANL